MARKIWFYQAYVWAGALLITLLAAGCDGAYDPLKLPAEPQAAGVELSVNDAERQREIPVLVYLPPQTEAAPVILFSHGLGGSRHGSAFLGRHWSARGYLAVFLQHPGSDSSVWRSAGPGQRMEAMQRAAGSENFMLRVKDVPAVLNQLEVWNSATGHVLCGRADMTRVGMSGHSFGAVTTQAVSGQSGFKAISFTEPRIKAAIAFSPSAPRGGVKPDAAFGSVKIPWMVMTGTKDVSFIGDADLESRLAVFPALPAGGKYELVLNNAEHSVFTDRALPGDQQQRNPNHHRVILALSTAFWDGWLRGDHAAKRWLDGEALRALLERDDRWQRK
ncbi:MAG: dienelactone hydrolase [Kiritimatiellae bacterium]|nr:dienelactone hydrolase [Kiritimatiellia bacterium]